MQLTCSTSICPDLLLPQALDFVKKAGFEAIELSAPGPRALRYTPTLAYLWCGAT